jgi:hypothetical protein
VLIRLSRCNTVAKLTPVNRREREVVLPALSAASRFCKNTRDGHIYAISHVISHVISHAMRCDPYVM